MKRNGYIDFIKFIFAIIIAEFHVGAGVFPGGRLAVEGFFMITGYFMMKSIERDKLSAEQLGLSTVRFMARKYSSLLYVLLPSALVAFTVICSISDFTSEDIFKKLLLLGFEVFPLETAGYKGVYIIGISWYLSSMFIGLAILFPFIKKFGKNFTLTVCPLITLLGYGLLCAKYGNLAVGTSYIEGTLVQTGILRALGGLSAGCLIYEITRAIAGVRFTALARSVFTLGELSCFGALYCFMHYLPKSQYDYLLVFVIFGMLIIGIGGLSYTAYLWNPVWTKPLGIASTLIVLNHYYWMRFVSTVFKDYERSQRILFYFLFTAVACVTVFILSRLLELAAKRIFCKKYWINSEK